MSHEVGHITACSSRDPGAPISKALESIIQADLAFGKELQSFGIMPDIIAWCDEPLDQSIRQKTARLNVQDCVDRESDLAGAVSGADDAGGNGPWI